MSHKKHYYSSETICVCNNLKQVLMIVAKYVIDWKLLLD